MSSDVVIQATGLSKAYRTYQQPADRLKQALHNRLRSAFRGYDRIWPDRCYYTEHCALHPFDLQIMRGETVAIIGKNGSGKSTLLALLCGTTSATSGEVEISGRVGALLELGSGFNPEFTGRENVYMNASLLGLSTAETEASMRDIASFADIGEYFDRPIKTYSSGMAMRLAFSVIAHVDCDILVIDEALAVGDAYFQQKCMRWLRQFQKKGTVLFVSHDVGAVLSLCTRAVWLDDGKTQMIGTAKQVCEAYNRFIHQMSTGQPISPHKPSAAVEESASEPPKAETPSGEPPEPDETKAVVTSSEPAGTATVTTLRTAAVPPVRSVLPTPPEPQSSVFDTLATSDSFGTGMAKIVSGTLLSANGSELPILEGGETVQLSIRAQALQSLDRVIVGFIIKDRLGQPIFGDNTLERNGRTLNLNEQDSVSASFTFQLPLLAAGRYAVTLAIATGSLAEHVQHHWIHDALMFDVRSRVGGVVFALPSSRSSVAIETGRAVA